MSQVQFTANFVQYPYKQQYHKVRLEFAELEIIPRSGRARGTRDQSEPSYSTTSMFAQSADASHLGLTTLPVKVRGRQSSLSSTWRYCWSWGTVSGGACARM